jgi:hypothetical protein
MGPIVFVRSACPRRPALVRSALLVAACLLGLSLPCRAAANPLDGRSMWIWYVSRSAGGSAAQIAAQARSAGVTNVIVKSGDGTGYWSQFSSRLVRSLHAGGLHVCAWQYVYGTYPAAEATIGADAVRAGADCLIIDAEAEYEGRYASAQVYVDDLRAAIGSRYPVGLASFPYIDYHPAFPYSVFLGPGGAQFNLPQMYWSDIGVSPETVFHHTYTYNRIYRRAIYPLGQLDNVGPTEVELFRGLTVRYRARGISWWDWAWAGAAGLWGPLSGPYLAAGAVASLGFPSLGVGSAGDEVVWLQQHLARAIPGQRITGTFAAQTEGNLRAFQRRRHLAATGRTGPATWYALFRLAPVRVSWAAAAGAADRGGSRGARARGRGGGPAARGSAPASAELPARGYQIPRTDSGPFAPVP